MMDINLNKFEYSSFKWFNLTLLNFRYEILKQYFKWVSCLELGCSDWAWTQHLVQYFQKVVAVDGSSEAINIAQKIEWLEKVNFIFSYFENLKNNLNEKFDTIILAHILEHVDDPIKVLLIAKEFLNPGWVILIDVPNAKSYHRQLGVIMGMEKSIYDLNDADLSIWHQRVYDLIKLKADAVAAWLIITNEWGLFLKVLPNADLETICNNRKWLAEALCKIWMQHPDVSAEIYIICKK